MIKHIVMFKLMDNADGQGKDENLLKLKSALEEMPKTIKEIKFLEVGLNILDSHNAFDLVLVTDFEDQSGLDIYQDHPDHVVVKEYVAKIAEKVTVVDYKF